jgi:hypothetical protein
MITRKRGTGGPNDRELDELLAGAWEDGAAVLATVLDLEGGRAALLRTARAEPAADGGRPSGMLAAVLAEADAMAAVLTAHTGPDYGPAHAHVMPFLLASRQSLLQLRVGLGGRNLSKERARQLLAGLIHALDEADRTLSALPSGVVTESEVADVRGLLAKTRGQLPEFAGRIARLFDDAGREAAGVPAPAR